MYPPRYFELLRELNRARPETDDEEHMEVTLQKVAELKLLLWNLEQDRIWYEDLGFSLVGSHSGVWRAEYPQL